MLAEIVAIGSEITSGAKLDTNSQWLSQQLSDLGISTGYHTAIADDFDANVACLRIAIDRADVVLVSGGLGPTLDDLTRSALAAVIERPLVLHEPSLITIEEMFRKRGRVMPERNRVQAEFPQGSEPLMNPIGTAPGIWLEVPRVGRNPCRIAALPGVPSELKRMFHDQVIRGYRGRASSSGGPGSTVTVAANRRRKSCWETSRRVVATRKSASRLTKRRSPCGLRRGARRKKNAK